MLIVVTRWVLNLEDIMAHSLIIVESPVKSKNYKYNMFGNDFKIVATADISKTFPKKNLV